MVEIEPLTGLTRNPSVVEKLLKVHWYTPENSLGDPGKSGSGSAKEIQNLMS